MPFEITEKDRIKPKIPRKIKLLIKTIPKTVYKIPVKNSCSASFRESFSSFLFLAEELQVKVPKSKPAPLKISSSVKTFSLNGRLEAFPAPYGLYCNFKS